jgi:DNA-binding response OmpR family regulator
MSSDRHDGSRVPRINPGCFTRAIVEGEAGEIEARLSRYGNWMVHLRRPGETEWRLACSGDMENGVLVGKPSVPGEDAIAFGSLTVDRATRLVRVGDQQITLSKKEFALLLTLVGDPYRAFGKRELTMLVWGWDTNGRTRTLETHVSRLRRKLMAAGAEGLVVNIRAFGYRLAEPSDHDPRGSGPSVAARPGEDDPRTEAGHVPAA